jgi:hypothetical protein
MEIREIYCGMTGGCNCLRIFPCGRFWIYGKLNFGVYYQSVARIYLVYLSKRIFSVMKATKTNLNIQILDNGAETSLEGIPDNDKCADSLN